MSFFLKVGASKGSKYDKVNQEICPLKFQIFNMEIFNISIRKYIQIFF
jgi:hypothetical protein